MYIKEFLMGTDKIVLDEVMSSTSIHVILENWKTLFAVINIKHHRNFVSPVV